MLTVRFATPADAPRLAALRYDFRHAHAGATEDRPGFEARTAVWMRERLAAKEPWHCWVLEDGLTIVGNLWLELVEKLPNPGPEAERHAYITNVYAEEAARGGAGRMLLDAALAWCRERGVDTVILWPSEKSRTLYQRAGFDVRNDLFALKLPFTGRR